MDREELEENFSNAETEERKHIAFDPAQMVEFDSGAPQTYNRNIMQAEIFPCQINRTCHF